MSGRARIFGGMKYKTIEAASRAFRNSRSVYLYCPCCTRAFKFDADYKAHYKIAHARPK